MIGCLPGLIVVGSTASRTYSLRVARGASSNNMYINGISGLGAMLGGITASTMTIQEIRQ